MIHDRRGFVGRALQAGLASTLLAKTGSAGTQAPAGGRAAPYRFKLAMWIDELRDRDELTLEQELEVARDIDRTRVVPHVPGETPIPETRPFFVHPRIHPIASGSAVKIPADRSPTAHRDVTIRPPRSVLPYQAPNKKSP